MSHDIIVTSSQNTFSFGVKAYPFQEARLLYELSCQTVTKYFCREKAVCQIPRLGI